MTHDEQVDTAAKISALTTILVVLGVTILATSYVGISRGFAITLIATPIVYILSVAFFSLFVSGDKKVEP